MATVARSSVAATMEARGPCEGLATWNENALPSAQKSVILLSIIVPIGGFIGGFQQKCCDGRSDRESIDLGSLARSARDGTRRAA